MGFHSSKISEYVASLLTSGIGFLGKISIMSFCDSASDVILLGLVVEDTAIDNGGHDHCL